MLPFQGADFFILFSQNITIFPKASPLHGFAVGLICVGLSARMNICYKSPAVFSIRKYSRFLIHPLIVLLNKIRSFVFQFWDLDLRSYLFYIRIYIRRIGIRSVPHLFRIRSVSGSHLFRIRFASGWHPVRMRFECVETRHALSLQPTKQPTKQPTMRRTI
jgi:hypothetical protein